MPDRQRLKVEKIAYLNEDTMLVRLVSARAGELMDFSPGQYLSFYYKIGRTYTSRPYSIASSRKDDLHRGFYDFIIYTGGAFTSKWLGENIETGFEILASEPRGNFSYEKIETKDNIVCLAGGLSFTPYLSFIKTMLEENLDKNIYLYIGWEVEEDVIYREELTDLARTYKNIEYKDFVVDYICLDDLEEKIDFKDTSFFIAGPRLMDRHYRNLLIEKGVSNEDIISEVPEEPQIHKFFPEDRYPGFDFYIYKLVINDRKYLMYGQESILRAIERAGFTIETYSRSGGLDEDSFKLIEGSLFVPSYWDQRKSSMKDKDIYIPSVSFPLSKSIKIEI